MKSQKISANPFTMYKTRNRVDKKPKIINTPHFHLIEKLELPLEDPVWYPTAVKSGQSISIKAMVEYLNIAPAIDRKAVLLIRAYDDAGNEVEIQLNKMFQSDAFGAYFIYLPSTQSEVTELYTFVVPEDVSTIHFGFSRFLCSGDEQVVVNDLMIYPQAVAQSSKRIETASNHLIEKLDLPLEAPVWYPTAVKAGQSISIKAMVEYLNIAPANTRKAVLLIRAYDETGEEVNLSLEKMFRSDVFEAQFKYLAPTDSEVEELYSVEVPEGAVTIHFGFSHFLLKVGEQVAIRDLSIHQENNSNHNGSITQRLNLDFSDKFVKDIKVAVIFDEFSFNSFKYEFSPIVIEPHNWREVFERESPDIFFCESAWSGVDSIKRPWKGKIYSSVNFNYENREEILEIIDYCNNRGIPTVFWNKEDPTHYPDKIHNFVETAKLFDFVFTTAEECVDLYKKEHNLKNVFALPFAAQPKLFNPMQSVNEVRSRNIVFAGSWYANHIERSQVMQDIFANILNSNYEIEFFNRYYGNDDHNHKIPDNIKVYKKPSVSNEKVADVYKSSIFGLNINTVTDSETMFARRAYELMSCYTFVISNYSLGMERMFGENVIFLDKNPNALNEISEHQIDEVREQNLHDVLTHHTYENRFRKILDDMGASYHVKDSFITYVIKVHSEYDLQFQSKLFRETYDRNKSKLILILSEIIEDIELAELYTKYNHLNVSVISESYIKKYGENNGNYIPSDFFIFVDSLDALDINLVNKAILHSCYTEQHFISLCPHHKYKYKLVGNMELRNVLAPSSRFVEVLKNYKLNVPTPIYFI